ncbi:phosphoprotein [Miniopterus schreibersii paramyxovirus]|uniref:phosphoprotein n=1 Tax=Miniopterus schreibersii paramyxovirus TaxID=1387879 RepID=UPI0003D7FA20|nr:phosphoprotein [Miniopterus schreibersii paramyxovirus]AGU69451.1 phosphoprotein [Miniopterus schreibersii paramyxovirus]
MSRGSDRALSIENGLAIAEFIQENRGNIQATYGRSSIGEPSTRDRTKAWELYLDKNNKSDIRQERNESSTSSQTKEQSNDDTGSSDSDERGQLRRLEEWYNAAGQGDYDSGYAGDNFSTVDRKWDQDTSNLHGDEGGSISDTTGKEESQTSNEVGDQHDASGGGNDTNGNSTTNKRVSESKSVDTKNEIPDATLEIMDEVIDETDPVATRKLKGISSIAKAMSSIPEETQIVKKTTGENTPSLRTKMDLSLKAGATLNVPQSHQHQEDSTALVENAQLDAQNAQMNQNEDLSPISPSTTIHSSSTVNLEKKLDQILENQEKMFKRLDSLLEIKEEIAAIKKTLANQSLAMSTIENYIGEMMIIIPKSGKDDNKDLGAIPKNPDLRPVIGRDHNRGKKEVTRSLNNKEKIEVGEDFYSIPVAEEKYLPTPINNMENNAANFVPKEDISSYRIIRNIIRNQLSDHEAQIQVLKLFDENVGKTPIKELYEGIQQVLFSEI